MRIILRPINRHTWSNVVKYKNCYDYIAPYYTRSGSRYTGLLTEDANRLGAKLGLNLLPSSSYWDNFFVRIGSDDLYLYTEDPLDEIKYIFLKNHKRVKTSIFERKATADYLLINEDEEAKRENLFNKSKIDAIAEFRRLSLTDMRKCLRLFGHNGETASSEVVENALFKIVEANPTTFMERWVNNKNREIEVVIEQAIAKNVIRRNKNVYKFGSDVIGYSLNEVIDFMNNPKNQDIKIAILSSVEAKDYISPLPSSDDELKEIASADASKVVSKAKPKKPTLLSGAPGMEDSEGIDISKIDLGS